MVLVDRFWSSMKPGQAFELPVWTAIVRPTAKAPARYNGGAAALAVVGSPSRWAVAGVGRAAGERSSVSLVRRSRSLGRETPSFVEEYAFSRFEAGSQNVGRVGAIRATGVPGQ